MSDALRVGDRVEIFLDDEFWHLAGWFQGVVIRIEPYSRFRSFYWVQLDREAEARFGHELGAISVLNPKNIRRSAGLEPTGD
jgi:hypothetical protein